MVLKKKNSQLSFLHCYHHGIMVVCIYIGSKWLPGGPNCVLGVVNTFVHVIMYFYYFMAIINPNLKDSLWWKKYITQIQIAQFAVLVIHYMRNLLVTNCNYPQIFNLIIFVQNFFMLFMFGDFYRQNYLKWKSD